MTVIIYIMCTLALFGAFQIISFINKKKMTNVLGGRPPLIFLQYFNQSTEDWENGDKLATILSYVSKDLPTYIYKW